jgi:hypothetical protein
MPLALAISFAARKGSIKDARLAIGKPAKSGILISGLFF